MAAIMENGDPLFVFLKDVEDILDSRILPDDQLAERIFTFRVALIRRNRAEHGVQLLVFFHQLVEVAALVVFVGEGQEDDGLVCAHLILGFCDIYRSWPVPKDVPGGIGYAILPAQI